MTYKNLFPIIIVAVYLFLPTIGKEIKRRAKIVLNSAEDIGRTHYTIIDNLKLRLEKKLPKNSHEFMHALAEELRESLCDEGDYECESMTYKHTLSSMSLVEDINSSPADPISHITAVLPDDFDFEVEMAIHNTLDVLSKLNEIGHEKVIQGMNFELRNLKESNTILDEDDRIVGISAISVAIESTKQWVEIVNDPDHVFFKVPFVEYNARIIDRSQEIEKERIDEWYDENDEYRRQLQLPNVTLPDITDLLDLDFLNTGGLNVIPIVSKDVVGGSLGAVVGVSNRKKKDGPIRNGIKLFTFTASSAVAGSVVGFFDSLAGTLRENGSCT